MASYSQNHLESIANMENLHEHEEQRARQRSAKKCKALSLDTKKERATFSGSGKEPYITTLTECTCKDFALRKLPCKHIYRLFYELGKFDITRVIEKIDDPEYIFNKPPSCCGNNSGNYLYTKEHLDEIGSMENCHEHEEQRARQRSAHKCTVLSIDEQNKSGFFLGSTGLIYKATLYDCDCWDFQRRNLPCKHIYRLTSELGLFDLTTVPPGRTTGEYFPETNQPTTAQDTEELAYDLRKVHENKAYNKYDQPNFMWEKEVEKLSQRAQEELYFMVKQWIIPGTHTGGIKVYDRKDPISIELINGGWFEELLSMERLVSGHSIYELRDLLKDKNKNIKIRSKKDMLEIASQDKEIADAILQTKWCLKFKEKHRAIRGQLRAYLHNKYPEPFDHYDENMNLVVIERN